MSTELSPDKAERGEKQSQSQSDNRSGQSTKKKPGSTVSLPLILVGIAILALLVFVFSPKKTADDPDVVTFSGRIETNETFVTSAVAAKVNRILVKEGDHVRKGQLLVMLDNKILQVKAQAVNSEEALARQAQSQAGTQVQSVQQDVQKAQKKSKGFFAKIFGSKKKKEETREKLTAQMKAAKMQEMQAKSAVIKAQAARGEVSAKASYFNITSPIDGIVITRSVETGNDVAPGQILLSVSDESGVYMKGFIPEGKLSQVKVGQHARVYLDSADGKSSPDKAHTMNGQITSIDETPSFTPQNIYFKDDRIKQVFGIKVDITDSDGRAKPGMPCDAAVDLKNTESK